MSFKTYPEPLNTAQTFRGISLFLYFFFIYPNVADRTHFSSQQTEADGEASTTSDYQEVRLYVFVHF